MWKIVCKLNMGGKINHDRVNKMSRACIVKAPLSHPLPIYMAHRKVPRTAYLADKPNAIIMRLSFLSGNEYIPIMKREVEAEKMLRKLIKKEEIC